MSQEDVQRITDAVCGALDARDLDGFLAQIHPEAEFRSLVAEMEGQTYRGHDGVREWWHSVLESLAELRFEREEIEWFRNRGVTRLRLVGTVDEVEVTQRCGRHGESMTG